MSQRRNSKRTGGGAPANDEVTIVWIRFRVYQFTNS